MDQQELPSSGSLTKSFTNLKMKTKKAAYMVSPVMSAAAGLATARGTQLLLRGAGTAGVAIPVIAALPEIAVVGIALGVGVVAIITVQHIQHRVFA